MRHVDVVVPTRGRREKLGKMLVSVPKSKWVHVEIYHDNIEIPQGAVSCRNGITPHCVDGVLYATDDIEFVPGAIEKAVTKFNCLFPDDDGVLGFIQDKSHHQTGVALVGQKFLQRYPSKMLFYPGYFHFAAQEVFWLADKLEKFGQTDGVALIHHHPVFDRSQMDQTHIDARIHKQRDHELMRTRKAKGLIWGYAKEAAGQCADYDAPSEEISVPLGGVESLG